MQNKALNILWVNVRLLHPLNGGDRLRTYHMLRQIKKLCHVTYVCPRTPSDSEDDLQKGEEYADQVITFKHDPPRGGTPRFYASVLWNCLRGKRPFASSKYRSNQAQQLICYELSSKKYDLVIADYLMSWIHFAEQPYASVLPSIVFQHNVESLIWQRHTQAAVNPLRRWICKREWQMTRAFEDHVGGNATGQIAVSEDEEQIFREERGMRNVLGWVPTGVDCDYFSPSTSTAPVLAFLGSMDWHANVDAIEHFVRHCYPSIKARCPDVRVILIGRNPTPAIRALGAEDASIEVTGTVDDVRPHLARASIMILPLRVGGGTRIKVFEGMAAGLALVSTRIGTEGLPVVDGEHALLADEPTAFAEAVVSLIQNPERRQQMANVSREWVRKNFSWETAAQKFLDLCQNVVTKMP